MQYKYAHKSFLSTYKQTLITLGIVGIVATLGFGGYSVIRGSHRNGLSDQKMVVAKVSQLMILPIDEEPALATITDTTKLTSNPFLAKAQNGDRILLYAKNQKAIIYRPSINKIVDVGPIISGKDGSASITAKVAFLNGTGVVDNTQKGVALLFSKFPNVTLLQKQDAPRLFPKSIVVDVTKKNQPLAEQLADSLGYQAGILPLGINVPAGTEILIIIGQQ